MTAPILAPDGSRCPDCRGPLTGPRSCPGCGLPLTGPAAARLWEVDVELLRLDTDRGALLRERTHLLAGLRTGSGGAVPQQPSGTAAEGPAREWTSERVQNLLLLLGGLLLAGAAVVFAAVTYERLGAAGRAVVLALLTVAVGLAAPRTRQRGLGATSETLAAVALALAALDAYGLRTLGLAAGSDPATYAAGSAAVLAVCAVAYARAVPLRVTVAAPVVLAQLPVPLLLVGLDVSPAVAGAALALAAGADLAVLAAWGPRLPADARTALRVCSRPVLALAVLVSFVAASLPDALPGAGALGLCAAVLAGAGAVASGSGRFLLALTVVPVLGAAGAVAVADLAAPQDPAGPALVLAAVALAGALVAAALPDSGRAGATAGAVLTVGGALLAVAEHLIGLLLPLGWLARPWTATAASGALPFGPGTTGGVAVPGVLLLAAVTLTTAGAALPSLRRAAALAGALATAAVVLLPAALGLPLGGALVLLLAAGAALAALAAALQDRSRVLGAGCALAAAALLLLSAAWSTAAQASTLVVLPAAALVLAGLAATRLPGRSGATALAGLLAAAEVGAAGAAGGLARDQVGGLLVVAVAVLLAVAPVLHRARRPGTELAAGVTGAVAVVLTADTVGWLSWALLGLGLLALATALRPDRRRVAGLGGVLLAASSWVRLDDAGITAPEPYVVPAALVALALGHRRRRTSPDTSSWSAYGPGLSLALVPSLVISLDDDTLLRPLLLGLAALAVLLVGAASRLQAPLVLGGAVLAADALQLLGPYAAALPRWLSLGGAGALLLVVGATYEQRRRDVAGLRERYDALT